MMLLGFRLAIFAAVFAVPSAALATPILVTGNSTGTSAAATGTLVLDYGATPDVLMLTLTNTSLFDARITAVGFDLPPGATDNTGLDGFSGNVVTGFTFGDDDLGNVPQFNSAVLDFGWITGTNFNGGKPNAGLAPGDSLTFIATGLFPVGLSDAALANALFVRFQRVGQGGGGSDVGRGVVPAPGGGGGGGQPIVPAPGGGGGGGQPIVPVPEPATATLLGLGVAAMLRIRQRRRSA